MTRESPNNPEHLTHGELDLLPGEAKSVLAVLTLAASWPARFAGGWVSVEDFASSALQFGGPRDRASLTAGLRRGLRKLEALEKPVRIEGRRSHDRSPASRPSQEMDRRLVPPISPTLQTWLLRHGSEFLEPQLWGEFVTLDFRPVLSLEELKASLEETVVRRLLATGRHEEARTHLDAALKGSPAARERRALKLCQATILLRRASVGDWRRAEKILKALLANPYTILDHFDRITDARIRLAYAYCLFLRHVRKRPRVTAQLNAKVDEIRKHLDQVLHLAQELSLTDRGQVLNLEGLLLKWEAQVATDEAIRQDFYQRAELYLRQALTIWRVSHHSYSLEAALYNLGELAFSRHRLHLGTGEEEHIREALAWYEASIFYTEKLGGMTQWILDYGKAIECIALLLPHLSVTDRLEESRQLQKRAEQYLEAAGQVQLPPLSWQRRLIRRVRGKLRTAIKNNPS